MKNELQKLQKEYNELHERMGYITNANTIAIINKRLDVLNERMLKIINGK